MNSIQILRKLLVFMTTFFLLSCTQDHQSAAFTAVDSQMTSGEVGTIPDDTDTNKEEKQLHKFGCFYYLLDKYATSAQPHSIRRWKDSLLNSAVESGIPSKNNLFTHRGGGPGNAEWNSTASLFCVAELDTVHDILIKINGSVQKVTFEWQESKTRHSWFLSFAVPYDQWKKLLAPIKKSDFALIYSEDEIADLSDSPNSPLGTGKLLKFELIPTTPVTGDYTEAFAVAYGE